MAYARVSAHPPAHDGWSALSDPTRRAIFERVATKPQAVGELAEGLPVSRPAVSQHLRVLKDAGLVTDRAEGNRRIYHADPGGRENRIVFVGRHDHREEEERRARVEKLAAGGFRFVRLLGEREGLRFVEGVKPRA